MTKKKIIVAPLHWGLGHATRCVPIIRSLIAHGFTPVLASDGAALTYLQQEFPKLESLELPSYRIRYGKRLPLQLVLQMPKILKTIRKENKVIEDFIAQQKEVVGLISDNRFGVRSTQVPSVYITHQLTVLSGIFTPVTSYFHERIIQKYEECWIPDDEYATFSGKLSKTHNRKITMRYLGVLSRFERKEVSQDIDVLIVLSGPEPNRTFLEEKVKREWQHYQGNVVLVLGKVAAVQKEFKEGSITICNYMLSEELELALNKAKVVMCRSGYSSIMDLAVLQKKAVFIPTKGQTEQEYLARYFEDKGVAPFATTEHLTVDMINYLKNYTGFTKTTTTLSADLFGLFQRERKF